MAGHELDDSTLALYRFDEAFSSTAGHVRAVDDVGPPMYNSHTVVTPVRFGPGGGAASDYARWFTTTASTSTLFSNSNGRREAMLADFTVEAWIYLDSYGAFRGIFASGGGLYNSGVAGRSTQISLEINNGRLAVYWERNGSTAAAVESAMPQIPLLTWTHVAITVAVSGGNRTVRYYVGGVYQDSDTGLNATGGLTGSGSEHQRFRIGGTWGTPTFVGSIAAVRVMPSIVSDADLLANASASSAIFDSAGALFCVNMREPPVGYGTALDEAGPYRLTSTTGADTVTIQGGPGGADAVDYCRWFSAGTQRLSCTGDAAAVAALTSSHTIEAWVWLESYDADGSTIVTYSAAGETLATNYLSGLRVESTGWLHVSGERGAGVNENIFQSAGATVPLRQWTHVAASVSLSGSTRTVRFFVGGVYQDEQTAANAEGGTSSRWEIGAGDASWAGSGWLGGIASIRVFPSARTDEEIAASAAAETSIFDPAGALACWNFREAPELVDHGPHGLHLHPAAFSTAIGIVATGSLVRDDGYSRLQSATPSAAVGYEGPTRHPWTPALQGAAEWTFEAWVQPNDISTAGLCLFGVYATGETLATNVLAGVGVASGRLPFVSHETGAGVDVSETGTLELYEQWSEQHRPTHIAVVKRSLGAGTSEYDWYLNGELHETLGPLADPEGGDTSFPHLGASAFGLDPWRGYIDDVRISAVARSAAEILASYEAGRSSGAAADETPPTLANLDPAEGPLPYDGTVAFDVLDPGGTVAVVTIFADYPVARRDEVIFDGSGFGRLYTGTRTSTADGWHFEFTRVGGWPRTQAGAAERLRLKVVAYDAGGNAVTL